MASHRPPDVLVQTRISPEAAKRLAALSKRDDRSLASYLRRLIDQHIAATAEK